MSPSSRAKRPSIAVGADNLPVVAWEESGSVLAKKWDGSAWTPMGGVLNRNSGKQGEQPQVAIQPDGTVHVVWREMDPSNDYSRVAVSRWNGSAWEPVGDFLTPQGSVADSVRLGATQQGAVVVSRERVVPATERQVVVRRWNGSVWQQLGGGALNAVAGTDVTGEPALAAVPNGDVVVAWIERVPGQPVSARGKRWDPAQNLWIDLPSIEEVDGDSDLSIAAASDVGVVLSRNGNAGLLPYIELLPLTTSSWSQLGLPDDSMKSAGGIPSHLVAGAPNGGIVTLSSVRGNLRVDRLSEGKWTEVIPSVNPEPQRGWDPAIAVANDGTIYVAYVDTRNEGAQLLTASYRGT